MLFVKCKIISDTNLADVFYPWAKAYNLTPQPLKSDIVENLTILLTFDPEERVGRRGHRDNFWSSLQDEHFDTLIVEIGQSWKFDLSVDLWPWRKGRISGHHDNF